MLSAGFRAEEDRIRGAAGLLLCMESDTSRVRFPRACWRQESRVWREDGAPLRRMVENPDKIETPEVTHLSYRIATTDRSA